LFSLSRPTADITCAQELALREQELQELVRREQELQELVRRVQEQVQVLLLLS